MRKILPALFVLMASLGAWAQVTSSSIAGSVGDSKGDPLPGATVLAIHTPSGTQYGITTNADGRFNIANMRIGGPYSITVSFVGYQESKYEGLNLKLGEPFTINIKLNEASTELSEIVVSSDRLSELNATRTGAATNISNSQINSLPTITRSITDFTRLTPQANGNSFGGRDGRYNNVQIDGANLNNGFGLSSDPLPGGGTPPISLDAIEEIQVNIAPFDVRQSGFSGAGVNAVTRSGTNSFTGSAYMFYRNQNLNGYKVGDLKLDKPNETSVKTYGFRLGGPIIKNKLFFFVNAEQIENKGNNPGAVNLWTASQDGIGDPAKNIARPSISDLDAVRNHLINVWGYNPGRFQGYASDNGSKATTFLGRIDWNISKKHRLAIRYNQSLNTLPSLVNGSSGPNPRSGINRVSAQSIAFENTMYKTKNIVKSATLELNSSISSKFSNQFLATYSRIQATRTSPSSEFPFVDIGDGTGKGDWQDAVNPNVDKGSSYSNYTSAGYELFTAGNDVLNDNYIFTDNLTYIEGKHTLTGGISFEMQKFGNQYLRLGTSYYRYASVADFLTTSPSHIGETAPINFGVTYPYAGQDTYAPIKFGLPAIYLQDKFNVSDKLELTLGVRAEVPWFMNKLTGNSTLNDLELLNSSGNATHYNTDAWPKTRVMVSPRVGFRWDVNEDNSFVVRGGTGIFTGRVPFVWLTNMPSNLGVIQNNVEQTYGQVAPWIQNIRFEPNKYYWVNNPPSGGENVFIGNPKAGVPSNFALVDNNFKMPQIWRTSIGTDYTIPGTPLIATADLLYTKDLQAIYQFGANLAPATQHLNYAGDHRDFWTSADIKYNSAASSGTTGAVVLSNTNKGYSVSATAGLSLPRHNGLSGSIYYTYTASKSPTDNPGSNAASAWQGSYSVNSPNDLTLYNSQYSVPSRIVANVMYRIEYAKHLATTISLFYDGSNQGRYSYTYTGDINGDAITDLIYVPKDASEINFADIIVDGNVLFTAAQQASALDKFIDNDKLLSKSRGGYADRNGALLPWLSHFDFRLLEDIYTTVGKHRNTLQLSFDIFNIGNMLNKQWGVQTTLNGAQNLLKVSTPAATANNYVPTFQMNTISENGKTVLPTTAFRDVTNATNYNTWTMQIGVRYIF